MHTKWHFVASLAIATVSLLSNQSAPFLVFEFLGHQITVFVLCIVVGVLVDIDHIVDLRLNKERFFEDTKAKYKDGRWFVVFHGIETVFVFCGLSILFPFLIFPTASYVCHIAMDVYGNGVSFEAYLYTVRFGRMLIRRSRRPQTL